jgi:hypothetical protein
MESGFFGRMVLSEGTFTPQVKVSLFQAAYNYTYNKTLVVDGAKGGQTNAAIEAVKKDLGKDKLDDANIKEFYTKFLTKLDDNSANINVGEGGSNNNRNLNLAIQALINLAGQAISIDGVIGAKTIAAIKTITNDDSGVINKDTIRSITGLAVKTNVQGGLGIDGIAAINGKTPEELNSEQNIEANYAKSIEEWKKFPCITTNNAYKLVKNTDGTVMYKLNGHYLFGNGRGYIESSQKSYTFSCENGNVKASYDEPAAKTAAKPAAPSGDSSPETLKKFGADMKKLLETIKSYTQKWGFYYKEGQTLVFKDSLDNKRILISSAVPEALKLQSGFWVLEDNKIVFKSKQTEKAEYAFKVA